MATLPELVEVANSQDPVASSAAFLSMMRLVVTDPASHVQPVFAFFCHQLESGNIPSTISSLRSVTSCPAEVDRALHSLKGIALIGTLHRDNSAILGSLYKIWNDVWAWLRFFHASCVDEERAPLEKRASVFATVSGIHKLFSSHDTLRRLAESTGGYLEMITQQWTLQIRIPELVSSAIIFPPASVLYTYTSTTGSTPPTATLRVIAALGGNPDDVARLSLEHLSVTSDQPRLKPNYALGTGADIELMANFRTSAHVRYALLSRHAVRAVTSILASISMIPYSAEMREPVTYCMNSCSRYLGFALESSNAIPFIIEALNAQLLPAMLRCGSWMPHMVPGLVKLFLLPLTAILPKYLLYISVLKVVSKALRRVRALDIETSMPQHDRLWDAWRTFKALSEERLALMQSDNVKDQQQVCSHCGKVDTSDCFILCDSCSEVWYCSEACQENGQKSHLRTCREVQSWRREGRSSPMSSRDFQFAGQVAQSELAKRSEEISRQWSKQHPMIPVVELDFTVFPMKMTVGSATSLRPSDYDTNPEERSSWDAAVNRAQQEHSAISRFCIPEGEYRKVGLSFLASAAYPPVVN